VGPKISIRTQNKELNKAKVQRVYKEIFNEGRTELVGEFFSEQYIQHKPVLPNGRQAVVDFIQEKIGLNPRTSINIKHIMAEGDLVTVHSHVTTTPADEFSGLAVFDLFRLENGMIVEHWDIIQDIPETTANGNSMFSDLYTAG
jgi:predicted SnoaL-like aldol condensation-catalyzing enzyme